LGVFATGTREPERHTPVPMRSRVLRVERPGRSVCSQVRLEQKGLVPATPPSRIEPICQWLPHLVFHHAATPTGGIDVGHVQFVGDDTQPALERAQLQPVATLGRLEARKVEVFDVGVTDGSAANGGILRDEPFEKQPSEVRREPG
jgi:hypothetical protein